MSETPAIRPHSPRQNRWALALIALLAAGSFGRGFVLKVGLGLLAPSASAVQATAAPMTAATRTLTRPL